MKKIIVSLIVVLVATSLFAGFKLGVSAGFEQFNGKMSDDEVYCGRYNTFGATVDVACDISDSFYAFDSFSMLFGKDPKVKAPDDPAWVPYEVLNPTFTFKNRLGVAYNIPVDCPVDFSAGASFIFGKGIVSGGYLGNLGLGINLKASYPIQNNFSAFAAVDGDFAFLQLVKTDNEVDKYSLFSFSFGAKIGVMYSF